MLAIELPRRTFLKSTGALVVTFTIAPAFAASPAEAKSVAKDQVDGFVAIDAQGNVKIFSGKVDLGTGVLALQLRTPSVAAMGAATLQALHPEADILLGIGISSPVVTSRWHGVPYGERPLAHVREYVALVRECLAGLPENVRRVIHARYYDDRNSSEIGDELSMNPASVRKLLFHARKALAECLVAKQIHA